MELFFPFESAVKLGSYVWLLLLALYVMCVVLWLLLLRPRLVIYNISADKLRPILADVVGQFDGDAPVGRATAWRFRDWACSCIWTTSPRSAACRSFPRAATRITWAGDGWK